MYKDTLNYVVLWDIEIFTCKYFKTTGPILMKFTRYNKWTHKGLYTNFQSSLKIYRKLRILKAIVSSYGPIDIQNN